MISTSIKISTLENSRLLDQMGMTTSYSTLKMTAVMMTADRVALGIKAQ